MQTRTQQVAELIEWFQLLKRKMVCPGMVATKMPRVTPAQMNVLMYLRRNTQGTVKEVAQALTISSSAATQLIDELVENSYVLREVFSSDRRAVTLTLSKKSKILAEKIEGQMLTNSVEMFTALTDTEFEHYIALTKKMIQSFPGRVPTT